MIRRAGEADREAIRQLLATVWRGDPGAVASHLRWPPDLGLVGEDGSEVVGYACARRGTLHPTHTAVGVHVHPRARGRGLGGRLWSRLAEGVSGSLKTATFADDLTTVRFLERRHLSVRLATHLDRLDLAGVAELAEAALPAGVRLLPFSEVAGSAAACLAVARLHDRIYAETHQHDPPVSFEEPQDVYLGVDLVPGWLWLAEREGEYVGVSSVRQDGPAGAADLGWFGTVGLPAAEARGVTLALTVRALSAARTAGVRVVNAEFDSLNPLAMWLREALPFRQGRVWLTFTGAR